MVSIASILFALALIIQLPKVQTAIVQKVVRTLDEKLDADISFEKIHFYPFHTLVIKNIAVIDRNPAPDVTDPTADPVDTLFRAEYITAKFSYEGLFKQESIQLKEATVSKAQMTLVLEEDPNPESEDSHTTDNLSRMFRLKKSESTEKNDKEIFNIRNVLIEDMGFAMKNHGSDKIPYFGGINWNDLDIKNIRLEAKDLKFKGGVMSGHASHLSFREKSGYKVEEMNGSATVGNGKTIIEDLYINDPWSELDLPLYMMSYDDIKAFKDFIAKVKIDAEISESTLDFKTLHYFAPQLAGNSLKATVSGMMSGYVNDFMVTEMKVNSEAGGFSGTVNGRMTGIPEMERTRLDARLTDCHLTTEGLGLFLNEWMKEGGLDLSGYAEGETFLLNASVSGLLNSMNVHANINSSIGGLRADMNVGGIMDTETPINITGTASTKDLDIGKVISKDIIGPVTMKAGLQAKLGDSTKLDIDSLSIDRLRLNGYDYSGIKALGSISSKKFDGRIIASDPNLNFLFHGAFALSSKTKNSIYQFYLNVTDANLNALNIDKRGKSKLRFQTNADFTRTGDGNILGNIDIANLVFESKEGRHNIGNINLTSHSNNDVNKVKLKSQFADGNYSGTAPITNFINDILNVTLKKETPAIFAGSPYKWDGHEYNFSFNTHNSMELMAFIMPGLYINEGTKVDVEIDRNGMMKASVNSQRLALGDYYIKDVKLSVDNTHDDFHSELYAKELSKVSGFKLSNNTFKILADDDHLGASYSFENEGELQNRGEFVMNAALSRKEEELNMDLSLLPSAIYLNSKEWNIMPSSIKVTGKDLTVDSLEVRSGDERIYARGRTSINQTDTLNVGLDRFDISILNPLIGSKFGLKGVVSGNVNLTSPRTSRGLLADILIDSTFVANKPLGTVTLGSMWDEESKQFDITLQNEMDGQKNIDVDVRLTPKDKYLEGKVNLNNLSVKYAEPLMTDIFSEMSGYISGTVTADGPLDKLNVRSSGTRLEDAMVNVAFTNVPYFASGDFSLDEKGLHFNDIGIHDRFGGTGNINGGIYWTDFKDIAFDTHLKVNSIEGINITKDLNSNFYGNAFGTGSVSITGPVNSLILSVDAITAKTGQVHIPMSASTTAGGRTDLLKFKEFKEEVVYLDPYESMRAKMAEKLRSNNDFLVKLKLDVSPNVEAFVELDETSGNVLSGKGNGLIELTIGEDVFNINGDYTLTNGNFNFSALGIVNRLFQIQDGSSINFSGDIMASTLNIDAIYETKTSLGALLSDDKSVTNRRTVECGIKITDKISNPRLDFSIEIPDLNPMVKSRVESALSTEDKVQKQFLSLLLSNSFLPDEQSGIFNNTSMLYSNVSEAMANQLSNILHKLDIPLDLGLKYQPTETGYDLFDVALSTQLFNNRLVVNGNIGNKEYTSGNTQDGVVGDLDIEIKLDRSGSFRANLFSHSADIYSNYLDNTQRNGAGLMYQTEFNSLKQFFKNMFSGKKKRQAAKLAEEQQIIDGERVEMKITRQEYETKDKKHGKR